MTCAICIEAQSQPRSATFAPGCESCQARALAVIGAHEESAAAGSMTEQYRTALGQVFGERWKQGHELVKEWAGRLRQRKARAA
jgi:hypothetical protein